MPSSKPSTFFFLVIASLVLAAVVLIPAMALFDNDADPTPPATSSDGSTGTDPNPLPIITPTVGPLTIAGNDSATPESTPVFAWHDEQTMRTAGVNELGAIPVLMYHAFTTDRSVNDEWTRNIDDFRGDLQWLYDHDFYVISVHDLLNDTISAPLGKHPVVLTFDDASARQFLFMQDATGTLVPDPQSAVGVMEEFFAKHPDFGHTAHFAVVPNNCFSKKDMPFNTWHEDCSLKLQWLVDHGYEVGNHTWTHENLRLVDGEEVARQVGMAAQFIDERVSGIGNMSTTLTLPFGEHPNSGTDGASYLANGVWWEGEEWIINAMFEVSGGPTYSPASSWWDPMSITRFNTDQASLDMWFGIFERGEVPLYTSDGNPESVAIPDPLPESLQNELDPDLIENSGKTLVVYEKEDRPEPTAIPELEPGSMVVTTDDGTRVRQSPSTAGDVIRTLDADTDLTIVRGPIDADGYSWWEVELPDGTTGWLVTDLVVPREG